MFKRLWSTLLVLLGLGLLFGLFDLGVKLMLQSKMGIGIRQYLAQYLTPHFDQIAAQECVIGAILLVGGLIVWFLPARD